MHFVALCPALSEQSPDRTFFACSINVEEGLVKLVTCSDVLTCVPYDVIWISAADSQADLTGLYMYIGVHIYSW